MSFKEKVYNILFGDDNEGEISNILDKSKKSIPINLPTGRISKPDYSNTFNLLNDTLQLLQAEFAFDVIPAIRKISKINPDMSQALQDLTQLANTGHLIKFDPGVTPDQQDKMREELETASKTWGDGVAGINGLVNKMISQLMIGGALSNEWVPSKNLLGITNVVFVNPESIRFAYDKSMGRYVTYQKVDNNLFAKAPYPGHIKLNPFTYKYYALNGDTDLPYGIPPYLSALEPIATQTFMIDNIKFIVETMGLMGYLDVKMAKPDQQDNESEQAYIERLNKVLADLKTRAAQGFRDGMNVGFKEDHEFDFKSTTRNTGGVEGIFDLNEAQVSSGLKFDNAFMGRGGNQTMTTVLFTKMLSQLTNIHNVIIENLKYGFTLHLRLRGFNFKYLDIEFNKSTITDDLKYNQAREIKQRVLRLLYADGVISQEQYADEMGYRKPDKAEPRVPIDPNVIAGAPVKKQKRKDDKDRSKRKGTDKKKPQGTIVDRSKKL